MNTLNRKRKSRNRRKSSAADGPSKDQSDVPSDKSPKKKPKAEKVDKVTIKEPERLGELEVRGRVIGSLLMVIPLLWSYWPTFVELYGAWMTQPDYSHGILVIPFAVGLLWLKRAKMPPIRRSQIVWGMLLLIASVALRIVGARLFYAPVDGYSIILWLCGSVWIFFGLPVLRWSLPAILFLWFMIPLPYSVSTSLSLPLQRIATIASTWMLQFLGQPAISEGNTILINETQLEVANACSGLRVFMGIIALAAAYLMLVQMSNWKRVLLVLSVVPIALLANALRIVVTAFLYQFESMDSLHQEIHDVSGWLMIPLAAAMFWLVLLYFSKLLPEVESMDLKVAINSK